MVNSAELDNSLSFAVDFRFPSSLFPSPPYDYYCTKNKKTDTTFYIVNGIRKSVSIGGIIEMLKLPRVYVLFKPVLLLPPLLLYTVAIPIDYLVHYSQLQFRAFAYSDFIESLLNPITSF